MKISSRKCVVVLSGVVCAMVAILWCRSYWRYDACGWTSEQFVRGDFSETGIGVHSGEGFLLVFVLQRHHRVTMMYPKSISYFSGAFNEVIKEKSRVTMYSTPNAFGFGHTFKRIVTRGPDDDNATSERTEILIPYWFVTFLCAIYPVSTLLRSYALRRRIVQRRLAGMCIDCGYDLRGHVHDRCPECGKAPQKNQGNRGDRENEQGN